MFRPNDPYTYRTFSDLTAGNDQIGYVESEYTISQYDDVTLHGAKSVVKKKQRRYILNCTMRINIYNPQGLDINPEQSTIYDNYRALINTYLRLTKRTGLAFDLLDYSPETVNTVVEASGSTGITNSQTQSASVSNTVGSTTSQTNSYGASVTLSEMPSLSANYEHSSTRTKERSQTNSRESSAGASQEASSTGSMSIKDWGSYALVNPLRGACCGSSPRPVTVRSVETATARSCASPNSASRRARLLLPREQLKRCLTN